MNGKKLNIYQSQRYNYNGYEIETLAYGGGFVSEVRGKDTSVIARFPKQTTRDAAKGEAEAHIDYLLETHHA